jgi:hypothetical protein
MTMSYQSLIRDVFHTIRYLASGSHIYSEYRSKTFSTSLVILVLPYILEHKSEKQGIYINGIRNCGKVKVAFVCVHQVTRLVI